MADDAVVFGGFAADYDAGRPAPARDAVDWLVPPGAVDVIELGAGTGLLTGELMGRGLQVTATDVDERMLAVLRSKDLAVRTVVTAAEELPFEDACADLVVASAAWHWFDPARTAREVARVLRPGGRAATVGTVLDPEVPWMREIVEFVLEERGIRPPWNDVAAPESGDFGSVQRAEFRVRRAVGQDVVVGEIAAWGAVRRADESVQAALLARVRALLGREFGGADVDAVYRSLCFRCTRR